MHSQPLIAMRRALLCTAGIAVIASCLGISTAVPAAEASGTLQAYKGGYRNVGDNTALNYAKPLAGAGFEYAPSGSGVFTPFPALSDATGLVSKSGLSNGSWKVRESSSPSGWSGFSQLHWNGSDRDYIGSAYLNDNTRTADIESNTGGTERSSERFVNAYKNPALPNTCNVGLKVLMLLDTSGSTSGFNDDYRTAAQSFVNELYGTPTKMKISSFATTIDSGNATTYDLDTPAGKTAANNRIQSIYPTNTSGSGFTNWDAILQDASKASVDVVVFVTDGNPTVRVGRTTGSADTGIDDITYAIASANLAKNPDMNGGPDQTILGVGIGTDISEVNMKAVSGPDKGTDYVISPTPTELTAILKEIAGRLCPGQLTLTKKLVPSDDPGLFDLKVDGVVKKADAGDGGSTGALTLDAGSHTVGESAGTGTDLANYTSTTKCTDGDGADVPVTDGKLDLATDTKVDCVITNTRNTGTITVEKGLSPSDDPGLFDLLIGGTAYATDVGDGGTTGKQSLNTGSYTIEEAAGTGTSLSDYSTDLACKDEEGAVKVTDGNVELAKDQNITCQFTNTRNTGTITVEKGLSPSDDPGLFDLLIGGTPFATDVGDGGTTGKQVLNTGSYAIEEAAGTGTSLADYSTDLACKDEEGTVDVVEGKIDLGDGQDISCLFTNTRNTGQIKLVKSLSPASDPGLFDLLLDGSTKAVNVGNGGASDTLTVNTGSHSVSEVAGTGTSLVDYTSSASCEAGGQVIASGEVTTLEVSVATDQAVTCTFTNVRKELPPPPNGTIIITKNVTDGTPGSFGFSGDLGSFSLTSGSTTTFSQPAGTYSVTESPASGFALSSLVCSDAGDASGSSSISGPTAAINLQAGETVACTWTNAPAGGVLPAIAGSARVSGSKGCVTGRYAYVRVRGALIDRVSYFISGKRVKTLTERNSRGRYYELRYRIRNLKPGRSKRVTAKVLYVTGASPETATLRWRVVRCAAKSKPKFTG